MHAPAVDLFFQAKKRTVEKKDIISELAVSAIAEFNPQAFFSKKARAYPKRKITLGYKENLRPSSNLFFLRIFSFSKIFHIPNRANHSKLHFGKPKVIFGKPKVIFGKPKGL